MVHTQQVAVVVHHDLVKVVEAHGVQVTVEQDSYLQ
jgi:hypothetical protein